ncbi:serine hydrolase domain-containing protein [Apilactobacillus ozensis]|uniref:serine hydrolase domain-containing protein n=1 Tax=Apilactobacillus ozensis TaxID=866801 RepID=UPI00200ACE86|nr:serine hydrolase domain-containing protein [Apilactobacillus ozensis]MCK8606974.1 beta-lactamase family protein [Apilactobacillus ozensis]
MGFTHTLELINKLVENKIVPGVTYAFIDNTQIKSGVLGDKQWVPSPQPLLENQIYDLASLTKVVGTVPAILQLAEQGRLAINDSISLYLPEWKYPLVTIRNLITHTSGIEGYIPHRNELNHDELIDALLNLKVGKDINRKMNYSDTNFIFLGLIAKKITGQSIQTLIKRRVLEPLNMFDSSFNPLEKSQCVPTEVTPDKGLLQGVVDDPKANILQADCGSAGLFSSLDDLIKYVKWLINPQNNGIISPNLVDELFEDQTINGSLGRSFGWAIDKDKHGQTYIWQGGYTGTFIVIKPKLKQALIFLSNRIHPKAPNEKYMTYRAEIIDSFLND